MSQKLGSYDSSRADPTILDERMMENLTKDEKKGLVWAGLALLGVLAFMAFTLVPDWGVLRNPETGDRINSPFFRGFVVWILIFFIATGYAYGRAVGTMKSDRDVIDAMAAALSSLGLYIVLVFFAAQFVAFFGWTNLGAITAVSGAQFFTGYWANRPGRIFPVHIDVCRHQSFLGFSVSSMGRNGPDFLCRC